MPLLRSKWSNNISLRMCSNGQMVDSIIPIQTVSQQDENVCYLMNEEMYRKRIREERMKIFWDMNWRNEDS